MPMERARGVGRNVGNHSRRQEISRSVPLSVVRERHAHILLQTTRSSVKIHDLLNKLEKGLDRLENSNKIQGQLLSSMNPSK
jgi:hypothetical protein